MQDGQNTKYKGIIYSIYLSVNSNQLFMIINLWKSIPVLYVKAMKRCLIWNRHWIKSTCASLEKYFLWISVLKSIYRENITIREMIFNRKIWMNDLIESPKIYILTV